MLHDLLMLSMSKNKNNPWHKNWEKDKEIGSGGQGRTFLAKPRNSSVPLGQYVLKILKKQKDEERRARMHREVTALTTLDHPGIPQVIDSLTLLATGSM